MGWNHEYVFSTYKNVLCTAGEQNLAVSVLCSCYLEKQQFQMGYADPSKAHAENQLPRHILKSGFGAQETTRSFQEQQGGSVHKPLLCTIFCSAAG